MLTTSVPGSILDHFPLNELPADATINDNEDTTIRRVKEIHETMLIQRPIPVSNQDAVKEIRRPGELYRRWRTIDDLPENARAFCEVAGTVQCLNLPTIFAC